MTQPAPNWQENYQYAVAGLFAMGEVVGQLRTPENDAHINGLIDQANRKWLALAEARMNP